MRFTNRRLVRPVVGIVAAAGTLLYAVGCSKNPAPETTSEVSTGSVAPTVSGASGVSAALSAAAPLLNSLASAIPGLSPTQAALGAGALLGLAKGKMPADQYSQVQSAIPGSDALVNEATKAGLPSNPTGMSSLTDFLGKAGISPAQLNQMVPVIGNTLQKVSPELATAFTAAVR